MKEKYNQSTPSCSYTTAMNALTHKLAIHSRATGKNAERALDDALVHARDAAHASAYSKLLAACGRDVALQVSEDIAQTVAVRLFDGKVRARIIGNLPTLTTADSRKRFFGKVIYFGICSAMRSGLRGPRFVSLDDRSDAEVGDQFVALVDKICDNSLSPSQIAGQLDSMGSMLKRVEAAWQKTKASTKVKGWSPGMEILGLTDRSDRPAENVLPKRTRERHQEQANKIVEDYRRRQRNPEVPSI